MFMGGGIGLILLAVIIWFVITYTNKNQNKSSNQNPIKESPLDILKKRYAHGEINKNEFDEKLKDLR